MTPGNDPLLQLLQQRYSHRWSIRRTEHLWIATAVDPNADHAPTLVEPNVEVFVRQLDDPTARLGPNRSLLSAPWFSQRLIDLADGAYRDEAPPSG